MTLEEYQVLVNKLVIERGFEDETVPEVFTLLVEEVGELAKAIRKNNGQKVEINSKVHNIEEELADVFFLTLDIANRLKIDLATAFENKEVKNRNRNWA